ncbi:TPA: efflux RND transporter permease subunit [Escherichia coli]
MFSRFFVRRPVFAWVIAILIMLAGILAIRTLPVAQYPDVAPPTIKISATYTGASAETLENSVTQVIEQQLTGLDNLLYFSSTSSSDGSVSINVTFEQGTDPDTAQVQVQNKIQQAESRLPSEVQQTGVTVEKSQSNFLLIAAVYDTTDKASSSDIADWLVSNVQDPLARVEGVGSLQVFGAEYAMRIWLDPAKLASYSLMPSDVQSAIEAQNVQVTAGKIGALPSPDTQQLTATVRAQSRLQTVALTLTPALCGSVLQHVPPHKKGFFGAFNRFYRRTEDKYQQGVIYVLRRAARTMGLYVVLGGGMALMMWKLPGSFLPTEDQGEIMVQYTLPAGATAARTAEVNRQIVDWFLINEKANTDVIFTVDGFSFSGSGQNTGMAFVSLKNWSQRKGAENTAQAIALRATKELGTIRDATVFAMTPPAVDGLGQSNGFTFELLANGGTDRETLLQMRNQLIEKANQSPELHSVRANDLPQMPQLQVDIDSNKAVSLGLSLNDVTDTLSSAWGGTYVNDFIDRGRVKKVYIQGDSEFRSAPSDLGKWFVRGSDNAMTPFSAFATTRWLYGPERLVRYNGSAAYEIQGENATGFSSGDAMTKMEELANSLPAGTTWAWSGLSLQEKLASGQALSLYAVSILVVFLCLAALYESWSVPFSVILVIPLGLLGAALAAWMRDLNNDVYFQVALLTTIGLSSKNAILIVEFAEAAVAEGYSLSRAALRAAQTRLRPIIMTSLAFIAGVMPLAIATGAGANSRIAIGTGIIGGTLTATLLAIFFVPLFFVLVKRLFAGKPRRQE